VHDGGGGWPAFGMCKGALQSIENILRKGTHFLFVRHTRPARGGWLFDGDGFGEVAGLVDVGTAIASDMVGEELEGDGRKYRHQEAIGGRDVNNVPGNFFEFGRAMIGNGNDAAVARLHFF
jgi:hypothetical protein